MIKVTPVSITLFLKDLNEKGFYLWMQKRVDTGSLNGLWEFPGGKIHHGENSQEAAIREVFEEVGPNLAFKVQNFKTYSYAYEGKNIILHVFLSVFAEIPLDKGVWERIDFKGKSGYLRGKIPPVNHQIIDEVAEYLKIEHQNQTWNNLWGH
jgi:mutator protein MutT